ncbi:LamG-like jellyroll fold domain-containing protein [Catenovulum sediminis]|nr:LamG-like jellyroll fold domain-containing protein [Catenovulum sediminis]
MYFAAAIADYGFTGKYRPKHYVPFKVPVYDEILDTYRKTEYNALVAAGEQNLTPPETQYQYRYRPEYQFSLLDFELKNFKRQTQDQQVVEINNDKSNMISSDDVALDILFSISDYQNQNIEPLPFLGVGQQLVMEVGGKEVELTLGQNQQLTFNNPADLHQLEGEDFLFLQLYDNQDPDNILWEYAFQMLTADTRWAGYDNIGEDGTIYVSADELEVPLQGLIVGYDEDQGPANLSWKTIGAGGGATQADSPNSASLGYSAATFTADCTAGASNTAVVQYGDTQASVGPIETVPGKSSLAIVKLNGTVVSESTTGLKTYIQGHKPLSIEVQVQDHCGNLVSDGTSVEISVEGQAIITVDEPGTVDGKVYATLIGASLPSTDNYLVVKSGEAPQIKVPFVVNPLTVQISDYIVSMEDRSVQPITVIVTDDEGDKVVDQTVTFESNGGKFKQNLATTNSEGIAIGYLHTGFHPIDDLQISARVGLAFGDTVTASVTPNTQDGSYLQASNAVVVGDETQAGHAEYTRYDGANIALAYDTQADLTINGTIGQSHEITLGTLADPNLMPLAAYHLNEAADDADTITEATGTLATNAYHTQLSNDHPSAGYSTYFNQQQSSYLSAPLTDRIKPTDGVSFRVDIKPQTQTNNAQQTADIFSMAGGAHKLTLNQDNTLSYTLYNDAGEQTVTSAPINQNQWHQVAGQYHNGQLTLQVNGTQYQQATDNSALNYGITNKGLTVGEGYTGHISSLKFFNPNSAPLVTFENNQTTQTVNLNQTSQNLTLKSTGLLNANNQQLNQLRIGVNHQGQQTYVSVISKSLFTQLSSYQFNALQPQGYPTVYQRQQYQGIPFIPMAHASFFDFSWDDAFDSLKSVAGFILPFEAIGTFYEQTNYLIDGDSRFDALELSLAGIEILTIIPIAKPLLALTKPLKLFIRPLKNSNPKFIKALGDVIGKLGDDIVKGKFDKAINLLPMMLIMGEMLSDEEARQGLMVMVNSITSADDIFAWADYLSLPADGWEGDEPPPVVFNATYDSPVMNSLPFISSAYALPKKNKKGEKVDGSKIGKIFASFADDVKDNPELLSKLVKAIGGRKGKPIISGFRSLLYNRTLLKSGIGILNIVGARHLRDLLRNKNTTQRVSGLTIIAVIAYLESRINGACDDCKPIEDFNVQTRIRDRYGSALGEFLSGGKGFFDRHSDSALFELLMIAVKHLDYELGIGGKILNVNDPVQITLLKYDGTNRSSVESTGIKLERRPDIVLQSTDVHGKQVWIEVKSYKSPYDGRSWATWHARKQTGGTNMKQLLVDRIASTDNQLDGESDLLDGNFQAARFEWWMHDFDKSPTYHSFTAADWKKLRNQFGQLKAGDSYSHASLGYKKAKDNKTFTDYVKNKGCIRPFNIQNWILSPAAKDKLLSAFKDELTTFYGYDSAPELPKLDFTKQC